MPVPLADAFEAFIADGARRQLSPASLAWYQAMLRTFVASVGDLDVDLVRVQAVQTYIDDLYRREVRYEGAAQRPEVSGGLSVESIRGHIRALRTFFNWCWAYYDLDPRRNLATKIKQPPRPRRIPRYITEEDLARLIAATGDDVQGKRDRAIVCFLADTGCRSGGLVSLRPENLQIDRRRAILHEKGGRIRPVPFSQATASVLSSWMAVRPPEAETVFCALGNAPTSFLHGEPMTNSGLNQMLRRLAKRAGVTGRFNPHSFRHGFAHSALKNGGTLAQVSRIMGHSSISTTVDNYGMFADDELVEIHESFSPIEHLRKGGDEAK